MGQSFAAAALMTWAGAVAACGGPAGGGTADAGTAAVEGGPPQSPSISGITPPSVFLARTTEVTLSGYATHWSPTTKVDFGPGIEVQSLVAASPTALVARVVTTKSTPLGRRDVTVEDGTTRERFVGAFEVLSPLRATFQGTVAQGSLARVDLQVLDTSTPFDVTALRDIAGDVTYPNLAIRLPAGLNNIGFAAVSEFELTFAMGVDVDAAAGDDDLDVVSSPPGATTEFPLPSGIHVGARSATPLASAVPATGATASAYDSALFAYTPAGGMTILDFFVSSPVGALDPAVALLPSSGHFSDLLGFGDAQTVVAPGGQPLYAVYWENTGGTGAYSVTATANDVAQVAAPTPADQTWPGAIAVSALPFVLIGADHATPYGADWVKLSVSGATRLHVQTTGDLLTDTRVIAYQSDATTVVGTPIDNGYAADGVVSLQAAGTYYVVFSQGMDYAPPHTTYTGILRVD